MSGYTNAIFDEEFLKSAFNKFVECGGEEFTENNVRVLLRFVEDALKQKTMSFTDPNGARQLCEEKLSQLEK